MLYSTVMLTAVRTKEKPSRESRYTTAACRSCKGFLRNNRTRWWKCDGKHKDTESLCLCTNKSVKLCFFEQVFWVSEGHQARVFPSWNRRGGCASNKISRSHL